MRTLYSKILITFCVLLFAFSALFLAFYIYRTYYKSKQNAIESGFLLAESLAHASEFVIYSQDPTFALSVFNGIYEAENVLYFAVYTIDGAVIYGRAKPGFTISEPTPGILNQVASVGRWQNKEAFPENCNFCDLWVAIQQGQQPIIGFARIAFSLDKIRQERNQLILWGCLIDFISFFFVFALARSLAKSIVKPLCVLNSGVEKIGKGNLKHRIDIKTNDEIEELARSFNQMAQGLQDSQNALEEAKNILEIKVNARTRELQELNKGLEGKVDERTKELRNRVSELERFHRLTVGRELKMIALKKELEKLQTRKRNQK